MLSWCSEEVTDPGGLAQLYVTVTAGLGQMCSALLSSQQLLQDM